MFGVLAQESRDASEKIEKLSSHAQKTALGRMELTKAFIGRYLTEIPKLPPYATDLAMKLLDDRTSPNEVAEGIKQDPSLAALVLQTVNSPYYGLRNKIVDYYRACLLLGFNNIHRLVLDKCLQGIMPDTEEFRAIQQHSYVVSVFAHEIAMVSGKVSAPMAGTIGLLHDLGKSAILLLKRRHPELAASFTLLDSSAVGSSLLATWGLHSDIVVVIEQQGWPVFAPPAVLKPEHRRSMATLHLAHGCFDLTQESEDGNSSQIFTNEYFVELGLPYTSLKQFYLEKLYPAVLGERKSLPEPVRKILSIRNVEEQAESPKQ